VDVVCHRLGGVQGVACSTVHGTRGAGSLWQAAGTGWVMVLYWRVWTMLLCCQPSCLHFEESKHIMHACIANQMFWVLAEGLIS